MGVDSDFQARAFLSVWTITTVHFMPNIPDQPVDLPVTRLAFVLRRMIRLSPVLTASPAAGAAAHRRGRNLPIVIIHAGA
jgi:hypothetical protein